jgi:hypothetical protein
VITTEEQEPRRPDEPPPTRVAAPEPPSRRLRRVTRLLLWLCLGAVAVFVVGRSLKPGTSTEVLDALAPQATTERGAADKPTQGPDEIAIVLDILFKDEPSSSLRADPNGPSQKVPQDRTPDALDLSDPERVRTIQQRLAALGYLRAYMSGSWDFRSRQALREFKVANQLPANDVLDTRTEQTLLENAARENAAFVGLWAPEPGACLPQNQTPFLPALINHQGAMAGETSCNFANGQANGSTWSFTASCSRGRRRWTANVKIAVSGDVLTWTSERGSQRYVRCPQR